MSDLQRLPVPQKLWLRLVGFLVAGRFGRIELDIVDGRIVSGRIIESIKVREDR